MSSIRHHWSSSERLLRLFREGFSVLDLAEPLPSLDETASAAGARALMRREAMTHLGVRRDGRVAGHVRADDLSGVDDLTAFQPFSPSEVLDDTAGLDDVLTCLEKRDVAFVRALGAVAFVVRRIDLEKPPMRMWLFGIISLAEMNVTWAVEELYPEDAWTRMLAPARVEKAQALQAERQRRGQHAELVSCLQLSDKLSLLIREPRYRDLLRTRSRREARKLVKRLESLRNHLAHAQPFVEDHWEAIQMLSAAIDQIVSARGLRALVEDLKGDRRP